MTDEQRVSTRAYVCAGSSESVQGWLRDASLRLLEARRARGATVRRPRLLVGHRR